MEEQNLQRYIPAPIPAGKRELIFGACILLAGLFLANVVLFGGLHLGFAVAMTGVICLSWWYLQSSGCKGSWYTGGILALCVVIAAGFGRSDDEFVKLVMLVFLFVGTNVAFSVMAGQNHYHPGGARSLFDAPLTAIRFGFGKMGVAAKGFVNVFKEGGETAQRTGAVLAGLGIAIPALAVVIPLLIRADAAFDGLIGLLPDFELGEIVTTAIWGGFLGCFFYSQGVGLKHTTQSEPVAKARKGLSKLTINTALGAVCLVYVAYFVSQIAYFVGGFAGILPEGYTAAEYARRGFFEMTWLCAINLGIITFSIGLVSRETAAPRSTRILCLFLGIVTVFFVCASVAKMGLYIDLYGLTRLRVLTMVIMAFLAVTTVLVCVWLFVPKLQYMKAVMLVGLAMGAIVFWADVDTQVAKYNVTAYLEGRLDSIDLYHLSTLGDGAVPYIAELTDVENEEIAAQARWFLVSWERNSVEDFRQWNTISAAAQAYLPKEGAQ